MTGIVLFELIQGAKTEMEKKRIFAQLTILNYVEMSIPLWRRADELAAAQKKKGIAVPVSDILLAVIALKYSLSVFTLDKHFEIIPGVKLYRA